MYIRNINVKVELEGGNLIRAIGEMENKPEGANAEHFKVEVVVVIDNFEIIKVENVEMCVLYPPCYEILPKLQNIIGITITQGYSKKIRELIGGNEGCTHMVELLLEIGRSINAGYGYGYLVKNFGIAANLEFYNKRDAAKCIGFTRYQQQNRQEI